MATRRTLERRLASLEPFEDPLVELEQYPTPADLAAHLVHLADLRDDLGRPVVDLGAGTGVLALGAALRGPPRIVGIERDHSALAIARANEGRLDAPTPVDWVLGDATRPPLDIRETTVITNPPFGAQRTNRHADRAFLDAAAGLAVVSYSVHNADSRDFVEAFAADRGGMVTDAFRAVLDLDRQFPFHGRDRKPHDVEVYRIVWS